MQDLEKMQEKLVNKLSEVIKEILNDEQIKFIYQNKNLSIKEVLLIDKYTKFLQNNF